MTTPDTIRTLRQSLGLNTRDFGELVGKSGRTVEDWEQGRRVPDLTVMILLGTLGKRRKATLPTDASSPADDPPKK